MHCILIIMYFVAIRIIVSLAFYRGFYGYKERDRERKTLSTAITRLHNQTDNLKKTWRKVSGLI